MEMPNGSYIETVESVTMALRKCLTFSNEGIVSTGKKPMTFSTTSKYLQFEIHADNTINRCLTMKI